jgi:hypothetical protein
MIVVSKAHSGRNVELASSNQTVSAIHDPITHRVEILKPCERTRDRLACWENPYRVGCGADVVVDVQVAGPKRGWRRH